MFQPTTVEIPITSRTWKHTPASSLVLTAAGLLAWVLLAAPGALGAPATANRYLYVLGCAATVDKLDTVTGKRIESVDLTKRPSDPQVFPAPEGPLEICLANEALYNARTSRVYTVAPRNLSPTAEGGYLYRVVGLSVPGLEVREQWPVEQAAASPPHLMFDAGGSSVRSIDESKWSPRVTLEALRDASARQIRNQILETTGSTALIRIFTADEHELVLAVAAAPPAPPVRLRGLPPTTAMNAHITPGGSAVLIEETRLQASTTTKTGRLLLFDATTGAALREYRDKAIVSASFLAIAPSGRAVYHKNDRYIFVALGREFPGDTVQRPVSSGYPGYFFADR